MSTTRRNVLRGGAAALGTTAAAVPVLGGTGNPDAELIALCQRFAAAELAAWYRYMVAPDDVADDQDTPPDFDTMHQITATPAITPEGWQAKALAYSALDRATYDDPDPGWITPGWLASLLRDMVEPARAAILARLAAEHGPLRSEAKTAPATPRIQPDADLLRLCADYMDLERHLRGHPAACMVHPSEAQQADQEALSGRQRAALDQLVVVPARTAIGRHAKARVLRARCGYLVGPASTEDDALAWSLLHDVLGEVPEWSSTAGAEA